MTREKYQVTITFDNNDYLQTYFNAINIDEIISHYDGYTMEYYNGEETKAWALEIKNMSTKENTIHYYGD